MAPKKTSKGSKKKAKKAAAKPAAKSARRPMKRAPVTNQRAKAATRRAKPAKPARKPKPQVKAAAKRTAKPLAKPIPKTAAKKVMKKAAPRPAPAVSATAKPAPKPKAPAPTRRAPLAPPTTLQRERRRLPEAEEEVFTDATEDSRLMSSARAGHDELRSEIKQHTETSPAMTAGDVDAKWQDAYALGDEAPGGDNMTPDQDRVDDIGKALGIEYADDEELLGGDELVERDEHRWELDPASKEDDEDL